MNTMKKRSAVTLLTLAIAFATVGVVYAVINYISTETQTSNFTKKTYFEMDGSEFFTESGEIGPGESMSINPVITSVASVDMYVFIRVEMPVYTNTDGISAGLYSLTPDENWSLVESSETDGQWIEVYCYNEALTPEASTTALAESLTMVDMTLAEYALVTDMDVSMTGYACQTVDEDGQAVDMGTAWSSIKEAAGV